jgi:hypothetical protein
MSKPKRLGGRIKVGSIDEQRKPFVLVEHPYIPLEIPFRQSDFREWTMWITEIRRGTSCRYRPEDSTASGLYAMIQGDQDTRVEHATLVAFGANLPFGGQAPAATIAAGLAALREEGLDPLGISRFYRTPAFRRGLAPTM